jgi:D-ribose pyranase
MKRRGILHPRLSSIIATMGHGDLLCVADAGLPIPPGVERVDLAFSPGQPQFVDVLDAVLHELHVEAYTLAGEACEHSPSVAEQIRARLGGGKPVEEHIVTHEVLKEQVRGARAVVRTGEFTPYANVLLRSGVDFD